MGTVNPFANDDTLGEVWELGYLAGFNEPEVDHFLPLAGEILAVYQTGEQSGRDDRRSQPPMNDAGGEEILEYHWVAPDLGELPEHIFLHVLGVALENMGLMAGGLISLVSTVVSIPGDTLLHPLGPEWNGPVDQEGDIYLALCLRTDHPMVTQEVTSDGYWVGSGRNAFFDAAGDMKAHGHAEAVVARCSLLEGVCGPVWAIQRGN